MTYEDLSYFAEKMIIECQSPLPSAIIFDLNEKDYNELMQTARDYYTVSGKRFSTSEDDSRVDPNIMSFEIACIRFVVNKKS